MHELELEPVASIDFDNAVSTPFVVEVNIVALVYPLQQQQPSQLESVVDSSSSDSLSPLVDLSFHLLHLLQLQLVHH